MAVQRVVFDASVWVSGLAYPTSKPARAVQEASTALVRSVISDPLIDQDRRALLTPRFGWSVDRVDAATGRIRGVSDVVVPTTILAVVVAKESDNRVPECAVEGNADVIVTGDRKHLLRLGSYAGIPLVSPVDFLRAR